MASRRTYTALATAMRAVRPASASALRQWSTDISALCMALEIDNPAFSRAKFIAEVNRDETGAEVYAQSALVTK